MLYKLKSALPFLLKLLGLHVRKASTLIRKAAEQGHEDAQDFLGIVYSRSAGVPQNNIEACERRGTALAELSGR